ncbi:hypothetical protein ABPG72_021256 [Tetrahymena utriculariae]
MSVESKKNKGELKIRHNLVKERVECRDNLQQQLLEKSNQFLYQPQNTIKEKAINIKKQIKLKQITIYTNFISIRQSFSCQSKSLFQHKCFTNTSTSSMLHSRVSQGRWMMDERHLGMRLSQDRLGMTDLLTNKQLK